MASCYLCNAQNISLRHPKVRDNDSIQVLECKECGLVFLSSFEHISDQFYQESGMLEGNVDLNKYRRGSHSDDLRRATELKNKLIGKKVLDFGCGAGGFLHLIKDICDQIAGVELDRAINRVMNAEGIRCYDSISEIEGKYDVITMFHVVEHLVDPKEILQQLKNFLSPNGIIIIEVPNADDALLTLYNNEDFANFTYWGCHVFLYNSHTLQKLVKQVDYKVKLVKQIQRYPLSNHMYWLSHGKPGGHSIYGLLNDEILDKAYESMLASVGKCDTIMMEIQV